METIDAIVVESDKKHSININFASGMVSIPISEDKPNDVKNAFNKIILQIKTGDFKIELKNVGTDLFSQVAKEYIVQLNREIHEVRKEMEEYDLTDTE